MNDVATLTVQTTPRQAVTAWLDRFEAARRIKAMEVGQV